MHEADGIRESAIELRDAPGHRAGVPMFEHPAGYEPKRIGRVRRFSWWFVGQSENARLAVGEAVKFDALPRFDIRIEALPVPPAGLFAIDHRPAQPTSLVIGVERREIVSVATTKTGIFLEQALLHIKTECLGFEVLEIRGHVRQRKFVDFAIPEQDIEKRFSPVLRLLGYQVWRPNLLNFEPPRELHQLPEIRARLAGRINQLMPEMRAS